MSTAALRNVQNDGSPQTKQNLNTPSQQEFVAPKKRKEDYQSPSSDDVTDSTASSPNSNKENMSNFNADKNSPIHNNSTEQPSNNVTHANGNYTANQQNDGTHNMNGFHQGVHQQYQCSAMNGQQQNSLDSTGPLPNEIFELLNEFWRPNDMVGVNTEAINGKFSRRSPDESLEDCADDEKEGEDDITSLADNDIPNERTTQKRRYSRLSDGYERLKSVLPTVKDKRRVSKARILDEAINYIQRLESITSVLKREHEKRLSMLNGSNGFFPDYSVQPYMRSLFQKQMYPSKMTPASYGKNSGAQSSLAKSPRMKQPSYNQCYTSQNAMNMNGNNMASTDYNYNSIASSYSAQYQSSGEQMMNGDSSPISNTSPYSACSLSPGSTPTTFQNGSLNNSWPYQGAGYDSAAGQMSSYNQSRQNTVASGYSSSTHFSGLTGNMWNNMNNGVVTDTSAQQNTNEPMKVG